MRRIATVLALLLAPRVLHAGPVPPDAVVYVQKIPNPNDYSLFANNGWDGNWYVGYNTCWIKHLPPVPKGNYAKAYLGAKIGRMKLLINPNNSWDKRPIPGTVSIAIASTFTWTRDQTFTLTRSEDIPLEGDSESAVEGTGESQWFWVEIPMERVNQSGDNFVALWSPTPDYLSVSSSPVLAAAWGGKSKDTWIARDGNGAPPRAFKPGGENEISFFEPAIALKLIPKSVAHPIQIMISDWKAGTPDHPKPVIAADVEGRSIQSVWVEYFKEEWVKIGRPLWKAPYIFTLEQTQLPQGRVQLRVAASNIWEERAASAPFTVEVSAIKGK
jgi:hypothetical protein